MFLTLGLSRFSLSLIISTKTQGIFQDFFHVWCDWATFIRVIIAKLIPITTIITLGGFGHKNLWVPYECIHRPYQPIFRNKVTFPFKPKLQWIQTLILPTKFGSPHSIPYFPFRKHLCLPNFILISVCPYWSLYLQLILCRTPKECVP